MDGDTVEGPDGWSRYILDCAIVERNENLK